MWGFTLQPHHILVTRMWHEAVFSKNHQYYKNLWLSRDQYTYILLHIRHEIKLLNSVPFILILLSKMQSCSKSIINCFTNCSHLTLQRQKAVISDSLHWWRTRHGHVYTRLNVTVESTERSNTTDALVRSHNRNVYTEYINFVKKLETGFYMIMNFFIPLTHFNIRTKHLHLVEWK